MRSGVILLIAPFTTDEGELAPNVLQDFTLTVRLPPLDHRAHGPAGRARSRAHCRTRHARGAAQAQRALCGAVAAAVRRIYRRRRHAGGGVAVALLIALACT